MSRSAYRVAYDGTGYRGFQRQPDVPTVEDELLGALRALGVCESGTPPGWAAAGRTDAGVSARAQTVALDAPEWLSPAAFSAELSDDVWVWAHAPAPADFHATHDATRRTYRYHLHAPPETVDDDRARAALARLTGEHDFHNLTPDETGTVRTLTGACRREGAFLVVTCEAGGFARQLVRRLVTLVERAAREGLAEGRLDRLLGPDPVDGPAGVPPAAPEGLVLWDVTYPDLDFAVDSGAREAATAWFADRRRERATLARVAGRVGDGLGDG